MIEPMGLDEVWCDITGSIRLFGSAEVIAAQIRESFKNELGITVSIGISYNKTFAKLGSDLAGRDEVCVISKENFRQKVWPLPVEAIFGVGRKTGEKLRNYGITTVGRLADTPVQWLKAVFGVNGIDLYNKANGNDNSPVLTKESAPPIKSVGHGITCTADLVNPDEVWKVFLSLSQNVAKRLRETHLEATGVQISVRDNQLITRQFQRNTDYATQSATEIAKTAFALFEKNYTWLYNVRSVTVTAISLQDENTPEQLELTGDYKRHEKQKKIDDAVMDIRRRFGEEAVFNCCLMTEEKLPRSKGRVPQPFMRRR